MIYLSRPSLIFGTHSMSCFISVDLIFKIQDSILLLAAGYWLLAVPAPGLIAGADPQSPEDGRTAKGQKPIAVKPMQRYGFFRYKTK